MNCYRLSSRVLCLIFVLVINLGSTLSQDTLNFTCELIKTDNKSLDCQSNENQFFVRKSIKQIYLLKQGKSSDFQVDNISKISFDCNNNDYMSYLPVYESSVKINNLKAMSVNNCHLVAVTVTNFKFRMLSTLIITSSRLMTINANVFNHLEKMKFLNLSRNHLSLLDDKLFSGMIMLEILDLSHNRLIFLSQNFIETNKKLQTVDFSNNKLKFIHVKLNHFTHKDLDQLNLEKNTCCDLTFNKTSIKDFKKKCNEVCKFNDLEIIKTCIEANVESLKMINEAKKGENARTHEDETLVNKLKKLNETITILSKVKIGQKELEKNFKDFKTDSDKTLVAINKNISTNFNENLVHTNLEVERAKNESLLQINKNKKAIKDLELEMNNNITNLTINNKKTSKNFETKIADLDNKNLEVERAMNESLREVNAIKVLINKLKNEEMFIKLEGNFTKKHEELSFKVSNYESERNGWSQNLVDELNRLKDMERKMKISLIIVSSVLTIVIVDFIAAIILIMKKIS